MSEANGILADWQKRVAQASKTRTLLRLVGGGTKDFYGQELTGERFDTTGYAGVVDYDPTELVITACCGTPLAHVERTLSDSGQMLAFEPPRFGAATVGGCVAAGLSGPRRPYAGAVRDVVLGARLLDGQGELLSFGGRVMKNVAGFDVSRLLAGSLGTLGIILEVSLKCLPRPRTETTRVFELTADQAVRSVNEWGGQPLPLSATCYYEGRLHARFSGAASAVDAAVRRLGGWPLQDAEQFWISVRDQTHELFSLHDPASQLWRLSVQTTAPYAELGGEQLIEWGGGLRWLRIATKPGAAAREQAEQLRSWARQHGGHATLFRSRDKSVGVFQAAGAAVPALQGRLKAVFDPAGIFNPGRMYKGL